MDEWSTTSWLLYKICRGKRSKSKSVNVVVMRYSGSYNLIICGDEDGDDDYYRIIYCCTKFHCLRFAIARSSCQLSFVMVWLFVAYYFVIVRGGLRLCSFTWNTCLRTTPHYATADCFEIFLSTTATARPTRMCSTSLAAIGSHGAPQLSHNGSLLIGYT